MFWLGFRWNARLHWCIYHKSSWDVFNSTAQGGIDICDDLFKLFVLTRPLCFSRKFQIILPTEGFNYWFKPLIALTPTVPAFLQNKVWLSNNTSRKLLFCSVQWTKVLTVNSCFQFFLQTLPGITFFRNRLSGQIFLCHVTDVKCYHFLVHIITTLLVFD